VLFALFTVAAARDNRTLAAAATVTALALATEPYIRGEAVSFAGYCLPRLAAVGIAVATGICLREWRNRRSRCAQADPGGPNGNQGPRLGV
jgi:hypothetical protein